MGLRPILARGIALVALVMYVGVGGTIAHLAGASSAELKCRRGFRAAVMIPPELRSFPIERHVGPGDEFTYTMSTNKSGRTRWRLRIDATAPRQRWQSAFEDHMRKRGFRRVGRRQTTPDYLFLQFGASGRRVFRLTIDTQPAEMQHITLEYWSGLNAKRWTTPREWARYQIYRIKRFLFRSQQPSNAFTLPS